MSRTTGFILLELCFLGAVQVLGGLPWMALGLLTCLAQILADFRAAPLIHLLPAVLWAAAHRVTGDRELFFPYAMYLAVHVAGQFAGRGRPTSAAAGGMLVAAFLVVRLLQRATWRVLAVELVVAALILGAAVLVVSPAAHRPGTATAIGVLASLVAFVSLAL